MKAIGFIICTAVVLAGADALAQTTPPPAEEGVERLLKRLDDIEKKRRQSEPGRIAAAAVVGGAPDKDATGAGVGLALWAMGVATAIFGIAVVVRSYRSQQPELDPTKALEIEESMWLGRGQRLLLVRAREQELLIGACGGQLTSLAVLGPAETSQRKPTPAADDEAAPPSRKRDAKKFASLVQDELTNAAAGTPALNKQQILRRLNSL